MFSSKKLQYEDLFVQEKSQLPERSRFYNLEPIGVGTPEVESFSGYISRLAWEHSVSPVILIKNSVAKPEYLPKVLSQNSIPAAIAANLNGFSETTEKMVEIFKRATFREDIKRTTLLFLKNKISTHGLLRKNFTWCPVCFQEQLEIGGIIYDKLIWTFEVVEVCLIHQTDLYQVCPYCLNKLKVLSGKSRPGFCSKCLRWLGLKNINKTSNLDSKHIWIAQSISQFLQLRSQVSDNFIFNLENLIRRTTDGNINDFAFLTGVWHLAIRRLLKSEVQPTLKMLIDICYPLDFSLINLFIENHMFNKTDDNLQKESKVQTKEEVILKLPAYLLENPPPSANEVARRINWRTIRFQRNFPDEYKRIVERYLQSQADKLPDYTDEQIEEILKNALTENPPPSLQSIFRKIGCRSTGYRYYEKFPKLCEQIATRYKNANNKIFDIQKAERILIAALKVNPTPSFSEVARRLKCSREYLDKKLPKLSAKLHKKYKADVKRIRAKNKKVMSDEIKRVINELQSQEKAVTENAVRKLLKRKWNDQNFKKIFKRVNVI